MDGPIPPEFLTPKMTPSTGVEDLKSHIKAFRTQMIISGGSDAIRCKMLMGTFMGMTFH